MESTKFQCNNCNKRFSFKSQLKRHQRSSCPHRPAIHVCDECGLSFIQKQGLNRHYRAVHGNESFACDQCEYKANLFQNLRRHKRRHESQESTDPAKRARIEESADPEVVDFMKGVISRVVKPYDAVERVALGNRLRVFRIETMERDPEIFLNNLVPQVEEYISEELEEKTGIKLQILLKVEFFKQLEPENRIVSHFWSLPTEIYRGTQYDVKQAFPKILQKIEQFQRQGSGWVIKSLLYGEVHLIKLQPLRGSTYMPLPHKLKNKKAIVNIKNVDSKCFQWCVIAAKYAPAVHAERVNQYRKIKNHGYDFSMVSFPVSATGRDIDRFERANGVSINVYSYDEEIFPLRISKTASSKTIHLLWYEDHYSLIKDLNKLLHDQTKYEHRKFFCPRCLFPKSTERLLDEHIELCSKSDPTKITLPTEKELKFVNIHKMLRQPKVVYADLECVTEKIYSCSPNPNTSHTEKYQKHTPCGYGLVVSEGCCEAPKFSKPTVRRCDKAIESMLLDIVGIALEHQEAINNAKPMVRGRPIERKCHICKQDIQMGLVLDHCHICGKFRGAAHNECNQLLRLNRDIVVVFHNLRKYDGHLIMQEIGQVAKLLGFEIDVIAKAMEDYISFSMVHKKNAEEAEGGQDHSYKIRFIDSVQFLNNSLDGLVKNLELDRFHALSSVYEGRKLKLLQRKGVYPYDYMDSVSRFQETQLPPIDAFYNRLSDSHTSESDYNRAQEVWREFRLKDLGEYHDLYLTTDVLLLADVFEEFRRFSLEKYELDPSQYVTTPSLAWDACLKMTNIRLELLQDPDMYMFFEAGIRGGISQISHRHARANNPMVPGFTIEDIITFIIYLDANNLYGHSMVQKLPIGEFRWMSEEQIITTNFDDVDGDIGYALEVDLEYPQVLHDAHNDYPLAPETMMIENISPYCQEMKEKLGLKIPPQTKLVLNLNPKQKYIVHAKNLKLYRRLGLKLTKIHRAISFQQKAWMESYILFNTSMRAKATNAFDKDLLKLFNNAVFGKTMENVRKYKLIELITSGPKFEKLAANPRFRNCCRFTDDLVGVCLLRPSTCLNKPIYCGFTVLELSKHLMYEFHYGYVVEKYGPKAKLLFSDTDSLCYLIQTNDIYHDMHADSDKFDFSDYPKDHPLYSEVNKKVIGKMKDELNGQPGIEFVGLRPKMYSMLPEKKRAKGIKKATVKKDIKHQDYLSTLMNETTMRHQMQLIKNELHQMYTVSQKKTSLSPYDDKRFLLNAIESRAHGHYRNKLL